MEGRCRERGKDAEEAEEAAGRTPKRLKEDAKVALRYASMSELVKTSLIPATISPDAGMGVRFSHDFDG